MELFCEVGFYGFPSYGGYESACKRAYYHDPEVTECPGAPQCRTEAACGVHRTVVDRYAYYVDEAECYTDCKTGKFAEADFVIGCAEDDEHEEECQQYFGEKSHA